MGKTRGSLLKGSKPGTSGCQRMFTHLKRADQMIKDIVSEYYISQEIDATTDGIAVAIPENKWAVFATVSLSQLAVILVNIAAYVDLKKYKKNPRGPKKPRTDRTQFKGYPHVSTAKLLKGIPPKFIMAKAG